MLVAESTIPTRTSNGLGCTRLTSIAPKPETLVVVNCAGRTRSIIGAQTLFNLGVRNPVYALENGTQGWYLKSVTHQGSDVTDTGIEFEPGTSQLTAASQARLADVITRAQARSGGEIVQILERLNRDGIALLVVTHEGSSGRSRSSASRIVARSSSWRRAVVSSQVSPSAPDPAISWSSTDMASREREHVFRNDLGWRFSGFSVAIGRPRWRGSTSSTRCCRLMA